MRIDILVVLCLLVSILAQHTTYRRDPFQDLIKEQTAHLQEVTKVIDLNFPVYLANPGKRVQFSDMNIEFDLKCAQYV